MKKIVVLFGLSVISLFSSISFSAVNLYPEEAAIMQKAEKINQYFSKRKMPLAGYGLDFVIAAEENGLPWNLLPAIAVQESSGGKRDKNNNPFGWGSANIKFAAYKEAISVVANKLATHKYYKDKSLSQKLWVYNPEKSYKKKIFKFMEKIKNENEI